MIVFSATHKASGKVFVGSSRVDLDFHWAMLLAQAEEGVAGALHDLIRETGEQGFSVVEYAEAENARELAMLCREAQEALGAELIRQGQGAAPVRTKVVEKVDEILVQDDEPEEQLEEWLEDRRQARNANVKAAPSAPVAEPLRQTRSTEEAADMRALMAGIEARRLSQRKRPPKSPATRTNAQKSTRVGTAARVESAAARERRIKAALAEEKAAREASKQQRIAAQADEMAALMARLDARTKVTESIRRRR